MDKLYYLYLINFCRCSSTGCGYFNNLHSPFLLHAHCGLIVPMIFNASTSVHRSMITNNNDMNATLTSRLEAENKRYAWISEVHKST